MIEAAPIGNQTERRTLAVNVVDVGDPPLDGGLRCEIGNNLRFDTATLETYFFAHWEPVLFDLLVVAAAVEFCDRSKRRPAAEWSRTFELSIPVHDRARWDAPQVSESLKGVLEFLTGDIWQLTFRQRQDNVQPPRQGTLSLPREVEAVMPFSDGLDSLAVAGILGQQLEERLVRVRVGSSRSSTRRVKQPFTSVPYQVRPGLTRFDETSVRSRGFKFAVISAVAAYLSKAHRVLIPESGQGALGPVLVTVGQAYPDYRSHPSYTQKMERFVGELLEYRVDVEFPRLWFTKGETLSQYLNIIGPEDHGWVHTRSCWQQARQSSVNGLKRQCGICAACMLRRLSVHSASHAEPPDSYVWEDLTASTFAEGASPDLPGSKITGAMRDYAIAGALHLDHLANVLGSPAHERGLELEAFHIARVMGHPESVVQGHMTRMLARHTAEWRAFLNHLGPKSFVAKWVGTPR